VVVLVFVLGHVGSRLPEGSLARKVVMPGKLRFLMTPTEMRLPVASRCLAPGQCSYWGWHLPRAALSPSATRARFQFAQVRPCRPVGTRLPTCLFSLAWENLQRPASRRRRLISIFLAILKLLPLPVPRPLRRPGRPPARDNEIAELRRYLSYCGFLLLDLLQRDPAVGAFEPSARQIVARIVAAAWLARVPRDATCSTIRSHLLDVPSGRVAATPIWKGSELAGASRSCTRATTWSARSPGTAGNL